MGTFYTHGADKKAIIAECTEDYSSAKGTSNVLAKRCIGNELWVVREETLTGQDPKRIICLYLLTSHGGDWGYKPMDESMGPHYYKCPVRFLGMVPLPCLCEGTKPCDCGKWRRNVLAYWRVQDAYKNLKVGQTVILKDEITIGGIPIGAVRLTHKQRGWVGLDGSGRYIRLRADFLN